MRFNRTGTVVKEMKEIDLERDNLYKVFGQEDVRSSVKDGLLIGPIPVKLQGIAITASTMKENGFDQKGKNYFQPIILL